MLDMLLYKILIPIVYELYHSIGEIKFMTNNLIELSN